MDLGVDEFASHTSQSSIHKKLKQNEVVLCDVTKVGRDDVTGVLIIGKKVDMANKGKETETSYDKTQVKDALASDLGNCTSVAGSVDSVDPFTSGSLNSVNFNGFNSDLSYHDDDGDDAVDDADEASDYDDNDDFMYDNDYLTLQAQFDNVDLPTGVEASVPWLKDPAPSVHLQAATSTSTFPGLQAPFDAVDHHAGAESKKKAVAASSSTVPAESSSDWKEEEIKEETLRKFQLFKRFDTVEDFSDHHFNSVGYSGQQPPKKWAKKIQDEWKILEKGLPDTIFVRVYESRMDLLRAVIIGPAGTPYHDGLFVFDVLFPPTYPDIPPMVYYYSGGLRLNPNLYDCGKVCLSLLNTWTGKSTEMWIPGKSTMLQVLVSIQGLILNDKPFFNEPGYEDMYVGAEGERRSNQYNEDVFILSLKTMIYTLRRPPKHFEDFVAGHFHDRAHAILVACKAYMEGTQVGSAVIERVQDVNEAEKSSSNEFKAAVARMMNMLVTNLTKYASKDCEQFRLPA